MDLLVSRIWRYPLNLAANFAITTGNRIVERVPLANTNANPGHNSGEIVLPPEKTFQAAITAERELAGPGPTISESSFCNILGRN